MGCLGPKIVGLNIGPVLTMGGLRSRQVDLFCELNSVTSLNTALSQ